MAVVGGPRDVVDPAGLRVAVDAAALVGGGGHDLRASDFALVVPMDATTGAPFLEAAAAPGASGGDGWGASTSASVYAAGGSRGGGGGGISGGSGGGEADVDVEVARLRQRLSLLSDAIAVSHAAEERAGRERDDALARLEVRETVREE